MHLNRGSNQLHDRKQVLQVNITLQLMSDVGRWVWLTVVIELMPGGGWSVVGTDGLRRGKMSIVVVGSMLH